MPNYQLRFICLKQLGSVTINFKTLSDDKKLVLNCCLGSIILLKIMEFLKPEGRRFIEIVTFPILSKELQFLNPPYLMPFCTELLFCFKERKTASY